MADQFDSPWKEAIEGHFADFLQFFFPTAHAQVDWSQPVLFLDKELRSLMRDAELGTRYVDKLVQLTRLDGQPERVYVHVEVQGSEQAEFAERMFVYHYRLYDRYRQPIASLAVLADERPNWRPEKFGYEVFGCRLGMHYPVAKLLDWSGSEARLEDSDNPFAMVPWRIWRPVPRAPTWNPDTRSRSRWSGSCTGGAAIVNRWLTWSGCWTG